MQGSSGEDEPVDLATLTQGVAGQWEGIRTPPGDPRRRSVTPEQRRERARPPPPPRSSVLPQKKKTDRLQTAFVSLPKPE